METKSEIAKAIIEVMKAVKGIEKSMTVGTGANSYRGVADKDVKKAVGDAMSLNGLCILPIGNEARTQVDRWEETSTYQGVPSTKMKQSVFTEVTTKYLLLHTSGESIEIVGYGHGVDSQDKSAGKATTYALKYALLYTFMIPTGTIEDADSEHSEAKDIPANKPAKESNPEGMKAPENDTRQWLNAGTKEWAEAIKYLQSEGGSLAKIEKKYKLSKVNKDKLIEEAQEVLANV